MPESARRFAVTGKACFLAACLVLGLAAAGSRMLTFDERGLPVPGLHQIPSNLGPWSAVSEQQLEPEVIAALRPDDYIMRDYAVAGSSEPVGLFVAYFKSLQKDYGPHSPRVCLPGAGWLISSSKLTSIQVPGRAEKIPVNQYIMQKGDARILVLYWYQNERRVWAEEYNAKLTFLPDLIKYRRSDASLVRLIAPMKETSSVMELENCKHFAELLFPQLVQRFQAAD
jgi:EpsI family protein